MYPFHYQHHCPHQQPRAVVTTLPCEHPGEIIRNALFVAFSLVAAATMTSAVGLLFL